MTLNLNDKNHLRILREKMNEALELISEETGIKFETGGMSYEGDGSSATIKINALRIAKDGTVVDKAAEEFKSQAKFYGLLAEDLGKTFRSNGKVHTITGFNSRAKKYPVQTTTSGGKRWKFPVDRIIQELHR